MDSYRHPLLSVMRARGVKVFLDTSIFVDKWSCLELTMVNSALLISLNSLGQRNKKKLFKVSFMIPAFYPKKCSLLSPLLSLYHSFLSLSSLPVSYFFLSPLPCLPTDPTCSLILPSLSLFARGSTFPINFSFPKTTHQQHLPQVQFGAII